MPTSTFSSDRRVPVGRWLATFFVGLAGAAVALAGVEAFWRAQRHAPTVIDSQELWSYWRRRIGTGDRTVVLVGSSRMQLDFSTAEFRRSYPGYRVVQLAIDDSHPVAVLRDLALDERFRGIVLCDISEYGMTRRAWESQQAYVDHARRSMLGRRLNARIGAWLESRLAFLSPNVDLLKLVRSRVVPPPHYLVTHDDRSREADYSMVDLARHRAARVEWLERAIDAAGRAMPPDEWLAQAMAVDSLAGRIEARGGRVAFIAFPGSGPGYDLPARIYPRHQYWDRFAARSSVVTLHFRDAPSLADFDCPDTSHLDKRDIARFTQALGAELERLGVLQRS